MIEVTRIDPKRHTCNARCSLHDAYKNHLNLNTTARWECSPEGMPVFIRIDGSMLDRGRDAGQCICIQLFQVRNGNEHEQHIAAAKTRGAIKTLRPTADFKFAEGYEDDQTNKGRR